MVVLWASAFLPFIPWEKQFSQNLKKEKKLELHKSGFSLGAMCKQLKARYASVQTTVFESTKTSIPHKYCIAQTEDTDQLPGMMNLSSKRFNWNIWQQQKNWWRSWRYQVPRYVHPLLRLPCYSLFNYYYTLRYYYKVCKFSWMEEKPWIIF